MTRITLPVLLVNLFFLACQDAPSGPIGENLNIAEIVEKRGGKLLPDACSIVPTGEIASILGLDESEIVLRNSTPRDENPTHSSCFFKWNEPGFPNSGILIQALRNPNEIEYPNYVVQWVESTKTLGEQGMEGQPVYFKDFPGFGDDGSYSIEAGKFYWRLGDQIYFMIAFNAPFNAEQQYQMAEKLAYKVTKNYISG